MKSDKELAVELACAVIQSMSHHNQGAQLPKKTISGNDIHNILKDCYQSVALLDSESGK